MRRLTALVLSLLLCAAQAGAQVKPMPRFPEGTTAKIVVPLGDTLHVTRIGQTIFDNKHAEYDVSGWKLGEQLEISLARIISRSGALKVEPMSDPQARIALDTANNYSNVSSSQLPKLKAAVKEYAAKSNVDVLVVVNGRRPSNEPFFGTKVSLDKYGIAELDDGMSRDTLFYAMLTVLFFDAHTGKQLAYAYHEERQDRGPLPRDLSQSPADLESARAAIVYLVEIGVARTIRDMIELRPEPRGSK